MLGQPHDPPTELLAAGACTFTRRGQQDVEVGPTLGATVTSVRVGEPGGPDAMTVDPDHPVYGVDIFSRLSVPFDIPEEQRCWQVAGWKVHDADVVDVLEWAVEKAAGRTYTVSVAAAEETEHHYLLKLAGTNPLGGGLGGTYLAGRGPVDSR